MKKFIIILNLFFISFSNPVIYGNDTLKTKESSKVSEKDIIGSIFDDLKNFINDSSRISDIKQKLEILKETQPGYTVSPFNDSLFTIYLKHGPLNAKQRVDKINNVIKEIYNEEDFRPDSLVIIQNAAALDLIYYDRIVMTVSIFDALWFDTEPQILASNYRTIIIKSINSELEENSTDRLLLKILQAVLILSILILIYYLASLFEKKLRKKVLQFNIKHPRGINIRGGEIISPKKLLKLELNVLVIIRWISFIIISYILLTVGLGLFSVTKGITKKLFTLIWNPLIGILESLVDFLPNLITIIVIVLVTRYFLKFISYLANEIDEGKIVIGGFYADWAKPTYNIFRFLMWAFAFVVIFPYLPGSDSAAFKGVSVFLGVLFSLGSSSAIANIVSGLVITYMRPFKIGDRVRIGEITGDVIEKNLLVTRVKTIKNEDITIPNSSIMTSHTMNYSSMAKNIGLILHTSVTIGYDAPWRIVHGLLINAAKDTPGILNEPEPFVLQTALNDFYVSYEINAFTNLPNEQIQIYSDLHQQIQDKFNEAGVEIMSPHYKSIRDGNTIAIPESYRPEGYTKPGFKVEGKDSD